MLKSRHTWSLRENIMAITNLTEEEKQKSYYELVCSTELTGGIHSHLIALSALNILLSITAFLGNTLILIALHKESSLHSPSKLLFRSLATTDLCVGIIVEPLVVTYFISAVNERWHICRHAYVAAFTAGYGLGSVSLFTLTTISLDRLFALLLGLRYRQVVTLKRAYLTVSVHWTVSILGTMVHFWRTKVTIWYGTIGISLCLVTSFLSYAKIFLTLRHQHDRVQDLLQCRKLTQRLFTTRRTNQNQVHVQRPPSQTISMNVALYRNTVSSALWVQLALVVCYLPYGIMQAVFAQKENSSTIYLLKGYCLTLLYLNSTLNPILYCWKMKEVRQAVKKTVGQIYCSSS